MWLIAAASLTLLPGARWHPAGGVGCGKARLRIPVAAAADTRSSSLEKRITKVESMLVELKALDVSEELVQSIKDELQAKSEPIHTAQLPGTSTQAAGAERTRPRRCEAALASPHLHPHAVHPYVADAEDVKPRGQGVGGDVDIKSQRRARRPHCAG